VADVKVCLFFLNTFVKTTTPVFSSQRFIPLSLGEGQGVRSKNV
jgi:hypothetical protein